MMLSDYVRILGRGPGRSRSLTQAEAVEAMRLMLSGRAAPEAVGALLMLLRMKGETSAEIAGLAGAARQAAPDLPSADLDWPSYAAGRTRGLPWFLLSARLVAMAGHRVLLHGWNPTGTALRDCLDEAGIPTARPQDAASALDRHGIVYLPLETLHPDLYRLLRLRDALGLRSSINTVCRMLNPSGADAVVQGVFHPTYMRLQTEAAECMNWQALSVIKGGGGEFERHPGKEVLAMGLRKGTPCEATWPVLAQGAVRLAEGPECQSLAALWSGVQSDRFASGIVLGTAALALDTLGHAQPLACAEDLWRGRHRVQAA